MTKLVNIAKCKVLGVIPPVASGKKVLTCYIRYWAINKSSGVRKESLDIPTRWTYYEGVASLPASRQGAGEEEREHDLRVRLENGNVGMRQANEVGDYRPRPGRVCHGRRGEDLL